MEEKEEVIINVDNIDVKKIMEKIKQKIVDREYIDEKEIKEIIFENTSEDNENSKLTDLHYINTGWQLELEKNLDKESLVKRFIKKVIRKSIRWYIRPILEQQVLFNASMVRIILELDQKIKDQEEVIEELLRSRL